MKKKKKKKKKKSLTLANISINKIFLGIPCVFSSVLMFRVFTSCSEIQSSIPGRVIPKTYKIVIDAALLNTKYYKVRIKDKWSNPEKGATPSFTAWCSRY